MPLPVLEASRDNAKPVELWRFTVGDAGVDSIDGEELPAAPAAPGRLVRVVPLSPRADDDSPDAWVIGAAFIATCAASGCIGTATPTSPDSAVRVEDFGFTVWAAYHGGLGGANAQFYAQYVATGLIVGKDYVVRALVKRYGSSSVDIYGMRINGGSPFAGNQDWAYFDVPASTQDGVMTFDVGGFAMQVGAADIVGLAFLAIYDPDEPSSGVGGPGEALHYARGERDFEFQGATYLKAAFNRSPIRSGAGEGLEQVELRVPRSHPVARLFSAGPTTAPVRVTVFHVHRQDMAAGDSFTVPFVGQVGQAGFRGGECVLTLESMRALLGYKSPSLLVQTRCANFLYDRQCQLNREAFKYTGGTVSAMEGFTLTISGLADSAGADATRYEFGFIIAPSGEHLFVEKQDGDTVFLLSPAQYVSLGDAVVVYWGCDRTAEVCHSRFGNIQHHNGRALMPRRNLFAGAGMVT